MTADGRSVPERGVHSFGDTPLVETVAHDGAGRIRFARVVERAPNAGINFVDLAEVPPGASIGFHAHGPDDEEVYVVVAGRGRMTVDDDVLTVSVGDVIVNRPGGSHGLENTGDEPLRLVVVDVGVAGRAPGVLSRPASEPSTSG